MMATPMTFKQGETLTAQKLTALAANVSANGVNGPVQKSRNGSTVGLQDGRNYIEPLRPFDVERATDKSILVRGGAYEYMNSETRTPALLTCDDGPSADPFEFRTISPTLSSDTAYVVYLEIVRGADAQAKVVALADFPVESDTIKRFTLSTFTTTASGNIPSFDPINTRPENRKFWGGLYSTVDYLATVAAPAGHFGRSLGGVVEYGAINLGTANECLSAISDDIIAFPYRAALGSYTALGMAGQPCSGYFEAFAQTVTICPNIAGVTIVTNGAIEATKYRVGGTKVVGAQGAAVAAPVGQANDLDTEARTAINALISRLQAHGLIV